MGVKLFSIIFELIMMFIFMLIGYYFYSSNGKATKYLTGFNMRKEEEKKKVDEVKITKEYGFILMMMALPFILGMFIDIFKAPYGLILAWLFWFVMFIYLLSRRNHNEKEDVI